MCLCHWATVKFPDPNISEQNYLLKPFFNGHRREMAGANLEGELRIKVEPEEEQGPVPDNSEWEYSQGTAGDLMDPLLLKEENDKDGEKKTKKTKPKDGLEKKRGPKRIPRRKQIGSRKKNARAKKASSKNQQENGRAVEDSGMKEEVQVKVEEKPLPQPDSKKSRRKNKKRERPKRTPEELEEIKKFRRVQAQIKNQMRPEEEREKKRIQKYFSYQARKARFTEEDWEHRRKLQREQRMRMKEALSKEQHEERLKKYREYLHNLTGEARERHLQRQRNNNNTFMKRLKERDPEQYRNYIRRQNAKHYDKIVASARKRAETESPEKRAARLLKYKVNAQKTKWRKKMEAEGIWSKEDIEKKLKEVEEEVRSQPQPTTISVYKPRIQTKNARWAKEGQPMSEFQALRLALKAEPPRKRGRVSKRTEFGPGWVPKYANWKRPETEKPPVASTSQVTQQKGQEVVLNVEESGSRAGQQNSFGSVHGYTTQPAPHLEDIRPGVSTPVVPFPPSSQNTTLNSDNDNYEDYYYGNDNDSVSLPPSPDFDHDNVTSTSRNEQVYMESSKESEQVKKETNPQYQSNNLPTFSPPLATKETTSLEDSNAATSTPWIVSEKESRSIICDECGKVFAHKNSLKDHKTRRHNPFGKNLSCPECGIPFPSPHSLWNHFSMYHTASSLPPELQPLSFDVHRNAEQFLSRRINKQNEPWNESAPSRSRHKVKVFSCQYCTMSLETAAMLWRHQVERHGMKDLPHPPGATVCEYCSEVVLKGYNLHIRRKHPEHAHKIKPDEFEEVQDPKTGEIRLKCPHCPGTYAKVTKVKQHIRNLHTEIGGGAKHPCPECDRYFPTKLRLIRHYNVHAFDNLIAKLEAKEFIKKTGESKTAGAVCLLCETNLPSLKISVKAHFLSMHHEILKQIEVTKEAVIPCKKCSEKFTSAVLRDRHMRDAHAEEVSFPCPYCPEVKMSRRALLEHERKHRIKNLEATKGICWVCNKDFGEDEQKVIEHVKKHHPQNFWPCVNCGKVQRSEADSIKHEKHCLFWNNKNKPEEKALYDFVENTLKGLIVNCPEQGCGAPVTMSFLGTHYRQAHGCTGVDPVVRCETCQKPCLNKMFWVAHNHLDHDLPVEELVKFPTTNISKLKPRKYKKRKEKGKPGIKATGGTKRRSSKKVNYDDDSTDSEEDKFSGDEQVVTRKEASTRNTPKRGRGRPSRRKVKNDNTEEIEKEKRLVIKLRRLTENEIEKYKLSSQ